MTLVSIFARFLKSDLIEDRRVTTSASAVNLLWYVCFG